MRVRLYLGMKAPTVLFSALFVAVRATTVCFEGYVMDSYCIERGRLLDNPSVETLERPDLHSVHCLVDVAQCYQSGFEMLQDPPANSTSGTHCRAFKLDDAGNTMMLQLARSSGAAGYCSTCTGGAGSISRGFRAVVHGVMGSGSPPTLAVTQVLPSSVGCPTQMEFTNVVCSAGGYTEWYLAHGSLMIISWGLLLPVGVLTARLTKHRPDALWFRGHRAVQLTGLLIATAGWIIALVRFDVFTGEVTSASVHGGLGIATMSLGILQPLNAFCRPHKEKDQPTTTERRIWEVLHKASGYLAVGLAVVTISLGTTLLPDPEHQMVFQVVYACVGAFLISLTCLFIWDGSRSTGTSPSESTHVPLDVQK